MKRLAVLLPLICAPAGAQTSTPAEQPDIRPIIQADRGKIHTCGINYSGFVPDQPYKQGGYVLFVGSVNLMYAKGKLPMATLKLQTFDALVSKDGQVRRHPFSPDYAYVMTDGKSSAGKEATSFTCDGGGGCGAFTDVGAIEAAMNAIFGSPFTIAYTRPNGSTDVVIGLPGKTSEELMDCVNTLLKRFDEQD